MSSRVLLISINRCEDPYPVFPLGLAHLDAALTAAGHETRWIDLRVNEAQLESTVAEFQPDCIGISIRNIDDVIIRRRETYWGPLTTLCPKLRQLTRAPIVLGGSGFSIFPRELLDLAQADFGVCGEGEGAFLLLLAALEGARDFAAVPGLVFRRGAAVEINERSRRTAPIAAARRPADIAGHYLQRSAMLNVQTQRGCSHRCCYCTYPLIEGRKWRRREPAEVAEEMAALQAAGTKYVFIVDSVFNSSLAHATAVCEALVRRGVRVPWGCFLRPQGLTRGLMLLMRRAGLSHIEFGSDSFCDRVLGEYDKRLTFADILESSALAAEARVEHCHFLISGGPGETRETMLETFENSRQLSGAVILALVGMRVYPQTPLHERALREGVLARDADFLAPQYYVSPAISGNELFDLLHDFSRRSPNWIVGDVSPAYLRMAQRLRAQGVVGPLWSYFATMQRLALNALAG